MDASGAPFPPPSRAEGGFASPAAGPLSQQAEGQSAEEGADDEAIASTDPTPSILLLFGVEAAVQLLLNAPVFPHQAEAVLGAESTDDEVGDLQWVSGRQAARLAGGETGACRRAHQTDLTRVRAA